MVPSDPPSESPSVGSTSTESEAEPPAIAQRPPLEVIEQGQIWLVEAYRRGTEVNQTFSTHDRQIDAVRAAKTKMDADNHPCTLRWDTADSVGNLYWNPLFECLDVRHDELLGAWTVVPEQGTCALAVCESRQDASDRAKRIQREYDFKHVRAYDASTAEFEERDHRFLRFDITDSGVRFDPSALDPEFEAIEEAAEDDETDDGDDDIEETYVGPASPGQLGASVPDVTKVEFVDTDGILHRYATPWGDGTNAEILAVARKFADERGVRDVFTGWLSRWRSVDDHPAVATVHDSGTDPAQWIAHQAGEATLASMGTDLPVETRPTIIEQVADAITTVENVGSGPVCGVHPERIHLHSAGSDWRASVATWGLKWAVQRVLDANEVTRFTAPEQLDGRLTPTTVVYQLGAVAYWLLCASPPITTEADLVTAIRSGDRPPARPVGSLSRGAGDVIDRALSIDPDDRYDSVGAFCRELRDGV